MCIAIVASALGLYITHRPGKAPVAQAPITAASLSDPRNTTYIIEGSSVTLKDGVSEVDAAPGSASKVDTAYFGNEARGDLDGDGKEDVAFILTQSTGGSGRFYYLAVALKTADGYKGTNTLLLGDRVAPQPTEIKNGVAIANFATRREGEPMAAAPSVGTSVYAKMENGTLVVTQKPE